MANFQVSQRLLELTRQSKRRIIEPEYYYDVIERYSQLFCPENTENNRLAYTEFWLKIDNAKKLYNAMRGSELNAIALCMQTIRTIRKCYLISCETVPLALYTDVQAKGKSFCCRRFLKPFGLDVGSAKVLC